MRARHIAGLVLGTLATWLGVNARRRAKAQAELDRIFNLSPDLVVVADFDGHFTRVNPAVKHILGYTPEEFLGRPYLELVHPDDREKTAAQAASLARGRQTFSFENRFLHKNGSVRVLEWTSTPVVNDRLVYGVARDITTRRRAEAEHERLAEEQAALRRVATLVAQGIEPAQLFSVVTREVARLFSDVAPSGLPDIVRFDPGPEFVLVGVARPVAGVRLGSRWGPNDVYTSTRVLRTGRSARVEATELASAAGADADYLRSRGLLNQVGSPIVVEGRPWGAITMNSIEPLPRDTGERLERFTELVATSIANAESREALRHLADEQAALRGVATLVARESAQLDFFGAVTDEPMRLLGTQSMGLLRFESDGMATLVAQSATPWDPPPLGARFRLDGENLVAALYRTGQAARQDEWTKATGELSVMAEVLGIGSSVATPIVVEGRLWGTLIATGERPGPLPLDTETRLARFADLVATGIANAEARAEVERLADEQAALRRVATVVARGAPGREVFNAIAEEFGQLIDADFIEMLRYEDDRTAVSVASGGAAAEAFPVGSRHELGGDNAASQILRAGETVRIDNYERRSTGPIAQAARSAGLRSAVGTPLIVDDRIWGAVTIGTTGEEPLPPDTEARLEQFTELMATAIANTEARAEVERLADEQAALRRVATVVARGGSGSEVFNAIAEEMRQLTDADFIDMLRYENDRSVVSVAAGGAAVDAFAAGSRFPLGGDNATSRILRTGQTVRIDNYDRTASGAIADAAHPTGIRSVVGTPLIVDDRLWGAVTIGTTGEEPLPPNTEARLEQFTELMATAIANTEARAEVERLADEQAALRRVATLAAQGASADTVLDAVAAEIKRLVDADAVAIGRYESPEEVTVVAHRSREPERAPVGTRMNYEGHNISALVRRTGGPVRLEDLSQAHGGFVDVFRSIGARALVGTPIVVEGRLWGAISVGWNGEAPPPADTEERMERFAELLETAIANADGRNQLTASRARLVTAADDARRRVVRDLHDGAQQRLVHTIVTLKLAKLAFDNRDGDGKAESLVGEALEQAERSNAELRELARGILPSVLTRGGLRAGVDTVVERLNVPVEVEIPDRRFPPEVEANAYFVIAEALTNVMKHSHARSVTVRASVNETSLYVEVRDDGTGGADPGGHGLVGVNDRVTALGGHLEVESPAGAGTLLSATLPLPADQSDGD